MQTLPRSLRILLTVAIVGGVGSRGASSGQQVELTLPKDDPNQNSEAVSSVAFSPDGRIVAVGYGVNLGLLQEPKPGQTILWDARSGKRVNTFPALKDGVNSVTFSPDGKVLAVVEHTGSIRLIAMPDGQKIHQIDTNQEDRGFLSVAFFPVGNRLAAGVGGELGGAGNDVQVWDVDREKPVRVLNGHRGPVASAAVSPDGKLLASGGWDGTARIWDAATGKSLKTLTFPSLSKKLKEQEGVDIEPWVQSVAFSPDGRTLATAAGEPEGLGEVDLWDTTTAKLKATLKGIDRSIDQVVFSPDGKVLATAGREETIKLWNPVTFQEIGTVKGVAPIAFSPDGKTIAFVASSSRTIVIRKTPPVVKAGS